MVTTVKGYFENSVSSHLQKNLDQCLVDNHYRALSRVEIGYKASEGQVLKQGDHQPGNCFSDPSKRSDDHH